MNRHLTRQVSNKEIKEVVFAINLGKAIGSDSITVKFFQSY